MNWTEADLRDVLARRGASLGHGAETGKITSGNEGSRNKTNRLAMAPTDGMNKTERAYSQYLESLRLAGEIHSWHFEAIKLRIGNVGTRCWWTPDFPVVYADGHVELHDTKGTKNDSPRYEDDAKVKANSVAAQYPWPVFFVWKLRNGSWAKRRM